MKLWIEVFFGDLKFVRRWLGGFWIKEHGFWIKISPRLLVHKEALMRNSIFEEY